jgi:ADP-L-glycero-D-manno-heptose 6-epimerase
MIVVTGGAGFIGSAFVWKLNEEGLDDIVIVDHLGESDKWKNLVNRRYVDFIHKDDFLEAVIADKVPFEVEGIIHMGACSSTTERDADYLMRNNFFYTRELALWAVKKGVRFIYASSAATYGDGSLGFSDDNQVTRRLKPINMYGYSKQLFDLFTLRHGLQARIAGVKFFNVFGPNEYHKGDMRSVVHKAFGQIKSTGKMTLFKSHRPDYTDGGQMRDFVYVKDCIDVLWWLFTNRNVEGIFNCGTGNARSWKDLVNAVFSAMGVAPQIEYTDMPESIRNQYQYFTEAEMGKIRNAGYKSECMSLENAVKDYVTNYLQQPDPHL